MKYLIYIFLIYSGLALTTCAQKDDTITPAVEPAIEFVSITPSQVKQFNSLEIVIQYIDGDGDLGNPDPDEKMLAIKDSRLPEADMYHVQPLAPLEEKVSIKGKVKITVPNVVLLGTGSSEQLYFSIKWKDRAGHWSNEITSPNITVSK
ncbi:MAG: hypothetical protein ACKVTZ_01335 [Bacteroidia bacterium]